VLDGDPDVAIYAGLVTTSGRIELLPVPARASHQHALHRFRQS
jgi:hypothetical protein